jgi:hypothetical protein
LLAKVNRAIRETIPADPDAPEFRLKHDLAKFRRIENMACPTGTDYSGCFRARSV